MKLKNSFLPLATVKFLLLFLAVIFSCIATAPISHANGRVLDYQVKVAGPYQIGFGSVPNPPRVGAIHVSVTVTPLKTENPIQNPQVIQHQSRLFANRHSNLSTKPIQTWIV